MPKKVKREKKPVATDGKRRKRGRPSKKELEERKRLLEEEEQDTHVEEKSNPFNPIGFVS